MMTPDSSNRRFPTQRKQTSAANAAVSARCRARVVSGDVLVGEEEQDCGDFRDQAWAGPAFLSLYAYCGSDALAAA
jgi:hypothetical protein